MRRTTRTHAKARTITAIVAGHRVYPSPAMQRNPTTAAAAGPAAQSPVNTPPSARKPRARNGAAPDAQEKEVLELKKRLAALEKHAVEENNSPRPGFRPPRGGRTTERSPEQNLEFLERTTEAMGLVSSEVGSQNARFKTSGFQKRWQERAAQMYNDDLKREYDGWRSTGKRRNFSPLA